MEVQVSDVRGNENVYVVERTLSRLNHSRRLSKDREISIAFAHAVVKISHLHILLKRL